ncbi:MAG TPA: hypothetical protein VF753_19150 [Terriglobales bacterium]
MTMRTQIFTTIAVATLLGVSTITTAQTASPRHIGPGNIVVKPKFGGQIYGYDIDRNGTEGIFNEWQQLENGNVLSGVEVFDQTTGKVVKVLNKTNDQTDQFEILGVFAGGVALVEHDTADSEGFIDKRAYNVLDPLSGNKYTGQWKPPHFDKNFIVKWVSVNQTTSETAFLALDNLGAGAKNYVLGSDVAKNKFGPMVKLTQPDLEPYNFPVLALDTTTNIAVVAQSEACLEGCVPEVALVDLVSGKATYFTAFGTGLINGIAVDSDDGIAVTTTADDAELEFYDLKTQSEFSVLLPAGEGPIQSGTDVEFDSVHKLFLVGQPFGPNNDSFIQVYDPSGSLVESVNFGGGGNVGLSFPYLALKPSQRSGFVLTPNGLQSFTY